MVAATSIISALAFAVVATNAVDPGQVRASINFYGSTNCGQNFIEQDSVFLPTNTPAGQKSTEVCYDLSFQSVGVGNLLIAPSIGNNCTLQTFAFSKCFGPITIYSTSNPFCKPPNASGSWRVHCE